MRPIDLLRQADASLGASVTLEAKLLAAYRQKQTARRRQRLMLWTGAIAASFSFAVLLYHALRFQAPETLPLPRVAGPAVPVAVPLMQPSAPKHVAVAVAPQRIPGKPIARTKPAVSLNPPSTPPEEFVAIPYAPPFTSADRGEVVRLQLPRQAIRTFGIPVNAERMFDRVPADVLVGEDGIPRGIRLIRASDPR